MMDLEEKWMSHLGMQLRRKYRRRSYREKAGVGP
jgi:hypothetical protein